MAPHPVRFLACTTALVALLAGGCTETNLPSLADAGCGDGGACGSAFDCPTLTCTCRQDGSFDAGASETPYSIPGACTDGCCNTCPNNCTP